MMDNNLIHKLKTAGKCRSLLKMNQARKILLRQLLLCVRVQFRFYLGFGESLLVPTFIGTFHCWNFLLMYDDGEVLIF